MADAVRRDAPGSTLSILDDGWGVRPDSSQRYPGAEIEFVGVRQSRRWHRPESWTQIRLAQAVGARLNPVAHRLSRADAVLDLSAGDSFTDLYGQVRLKTVTEPKRAALRAGRPLILLPQTYGPFNTADGRRLAERLIRSAAIAYSRDPRSHDCLLELAGADTDRSKLRRGVDIAFALEPRTPAPGVAEVVTSLRQVVTAGVNVSGLLQDEAAHARFGLAGNYLITMTSLVRRLLAAEAHVVLVPHVHVAGGLGESDIGAIKRLLESLAPTERERVTTLPPDLGAAEAKWCIGQLDWFVGSRMHSTIAALSTLTPAAAYAYSDKTLGVFQTCGVGDQVVDARRLGGEEAVSRILESFAARDLTRQRLEEPATNTVTASRLQLRDIFKQIEGLADRLPYGEA